MSDIKHTPGPWQRFSTSPESVADILKMFSGAQKVLASLGKRRNTRHLRRLHWFLSLNMRETRNRELTSFLPTMRLSPPHLNCCARMRLQSVP